MSCFYVAVSPLRTGSVVKIGMSRFDDPYRRISSHRTSCNNPFGRPLRSLRTAFWVQFPFDSEAFAVEKYIKRFAERNLPWSKTATAEYELALPRSRTGSNPSGEWFISSDDEYDAVDGVLHVCRRSLEAESRSPFSHLRQASHMFCDAIEFWFERRTEISVKLVCA